jgi:hypothetical protein
MILYSCEGAAAAAIHIPFSPVTEVLPADISTEVTVGPRHKTLNISSETSMVCLQKLKDATSFLILKATSNMNFIGIIT